jgi:uncharacterized protein (UPF0335 family)
MTAPIGHNSQTESGRRLKSIIERVERLEEERKGLGDDIKEIYTEAKGNGFDTKTIKTIIRLRRMSEADRREQQELVETYKTAIGMDD